MDNRSSLEHAFLTKQEKSALQRIYSKWVSHVSPNEMKDVFYTQSLITDRDRETIDKKLTTSERNEFLYDRLSKCTYPQVKTLRDELLQSNTASHRILAESLPCRRTNLQSAAQSDSSQQQQGFAYQPGFQSTHQPGFQGTHEPDRQYSHPQPHAHNYQYDTQYSGPAQSPGNQANPTMQPPASGPPLEAEKKKQLREYPSIQNAKGLCMIIANFLDELKGYEADIENITKFFRQTLNFDVWGGSDENSKDKYRNLTTAGFMERMRDAQKYLNDNQGKYDRFFLFVLSHGDESGITTVSTEGIDEKKSSDQPQQPLTSASDKDTKHYVKVDEIVEMFTHEENAVPVLKGLPKCFFFQVCGGDETIKAAAGSDRQYYDIEEKTAAPAQNHSNGIVAVGADVLLCHASKTGYQSFVGDLQGSWFIRSLLEVFEEHLEEEHLLDMMTEVTDKISQMKGKIDRKRVWQLPMVCSALTKKLYLKKAIA